MQSSYQFYIERMAAALRDSQLHQNIADGFVTRASVESAQQAVDSLFADGHDPSVIADCLALTFDMDVVDEPQQGLAAHGTGWVLSTEGVLCLRNPFDRDLRNHLTYEHGSEIAQWAILRVTDNVVIDAEGATTHGGASVDETLLDQVLLEAYRHDTSDIHLRVKRNEAVVRMRIDGRLRDVQNIPLNGTYTGLINRILVRCGETPGAYISPVSGQFTHPVGQAQIPIRVELLPTRVRGLTYPNVTLRLMGTTSHLKNIDELGFPEQPNNRQLSLIRSFTRRPSGLILVTGPTGSGKTTTLYAMMQRMLKMAPDKAYYTLEDPQEVELPGVDQIQINRDAGLTFDSGLRSLLRKDPDVILVGEIRDKETMDEAIRASLTGHLVLSTLHANSAIASFMRLADMGCVSTLMGNAIVGILAQRVVRRVCPDCAVALSWRQLYTLDHPRVADVPEEMAQRYRDARHAYSDLADCPDDDNQVLIAGDGCPSCHHTAHAGRRLITETLKMDRAMRDLVSSNASQGDLLQHAIGQGGYVDMWGHAMTLIRNKEITLDEALDVLEEREIGRCLPAHSTTLTDSADAPPSPRLAAAAHV